MTRFHLFPASIILLVMSILPLHLKAQTQTSDYKDKIEAVRRATVPDKRVAVYDIRVSEEGDKLVVSGKTTSEKAKAELLKTLSQESATLVDQVEVWPFASLGDKPYGVIDLSVICMNGDPEFGAEQVTQGLLGMPVRIVDEDDWLRIQTPDGYLGWVTALGVARMDKAQYNAWIAAPKVICTALSATAYRSPTEQSEPVSDLVCGNMLRLLGEKGAFYKVGFPGGREAYVSKKECKPVETWQKEIKLTTESLLKTARSLMGVPYVWGGTSSKGVDCSGLIKVAAFMHGLILQRDASQQAYTGHPVDLSDGYKALQPGDLLFFGTPATADKRERVSHVAFYLGNNEFIHASTRVRVNSLDPQSAIYDSHNAKRLIRATRIIDAVGTKGVESITENPFYQPQ